jgi:hypothetical protein
MFVGCAGNEDNVAGSGQFGLGTRAISGSILNVPFSELRVLQRKI